jgi:NADH:ubiquinone reductase (H+-translocating)
MLLYYTSILCFVYDTNYIWCDKCTGGIITERFCMYKIVIVGAGFAGLNAAKTLGKFAKSFPQNHFEITVIDRRNHHLFQPLLYQVATAGLSPADIAAPIRKVLSSYPHIKVLLGEVEKINAETQHIETSIGTIDYDYLLLACGATHSYFGNNQWEKYAPGLKSIEQATEIRRRILSAFEKAENESDKQKRKALMTFVIVGGGPTGVELAGALGEISRFTLAKNFRTIDPSRTRIILIDSGDRILKTFDPELSLSATRSLEELGVTVWTSMRVTQIDAEGVWMGDEYLQAHTVLWAAGIKASTLNQDLKTETDGIGRVKVLDTLQLQAHLEIFVVGDQAHVTYQDPTQESTELNANLKSTISSVPPLAPAAIQQGIHAAHNLIALIKNEPLQDFKYHDKGMMATIGRSAAIAQSGKMKLTGMLAWMAWGFIHILYLIGFRNKLMVLFQWFWSYLRFNRGARLITHDDWRLYPVVDKSTINKSSHSPKAQPPSS